VTDVVPPAQPHPEFALNDSGWPAWNTPERRRRSFHDFAGFSRWGIRIRAARVRPLPREIEFRIGELPTVRIVPATRDGTDPAYAARRIAMAEEIFAFCERT
jgi:hypothetical protein